MKSHFLIKMPHGTIGAYDEEETWSEKRVGVVDQVLRTTSSLM
jgi:hypothetical protein